jgi:hypothetical protein
MIDSTVQLTTCRKWGKLRHHASECCTKSIQEVTTEDTSHNEIYFGAVQQADSDKDPWQVELYIAGCLVTFKIETGADATVIPKKPAEKISFTSSNPCKEGVKL